MIRVYAMKHFLRAWWSNPVPYEYNLPMIPPHTTSHLNLPPSPPPLHVHAFQWQVLKAYEASKVDKVVVMKEFDEKKATMDAKKATTAVREKTPQHILRKTKKTKEQARVPFRFRT